MRLISGFSVTSALICSNWCRLNPVVLHPVNANLGLHGDISDKGKLDKNIYHQNFFGAFCIQKHQPKSINQTSAT